MTSKILTKTDERVRGHAAKHHVDLERKYKPHPAAECFPTMDEDRFLEFVASIRRDGLQEDIVLLDGMILDGRHRLRACSQLGIEPRFRDAPKGINPYRYVENENIERRDLSSEQRYVIRRRLEKHADSWARKHREREANKKRSDAANARPRENGRLAASETPNGALLEPKRAKTKNGTQARVDKLLSLAPHLEQAIVDGTIKASRELKKLEQATARAKVEEAQRAAPERAIVRQQDQAAFLAALPAASVDLLLTDPPYATDVDDIDLFAPWLIPALEKLKPTGRAYVCVGAYPRELLAYLNVLRAVDALDRSQVLVWTYRNTLGPSPKVDYKLNWQAVLYIRGVDAPPLDCPVMTEQFSVQDINAPDGRLGDRYHAWQKPDELAERFVRHGSKPGDLVIDPFACTGTFLLAAARLSRRALGCDISEENLKIAVQRGCVLEAV